MFATVTRDDDVAVLEANTGIDAGNEVGITPVTGEADELAGESEAISLRDAPCATHVLAGARLFVLPHGSAGKGLQPLDALRCNVHDRSKNWIAGIASVRVGSVLTGHVHPAPVRVLHYLEGARWLDRSGIGTATRQHRRALEEADVPLETSPWDGVTAPLQAMLGTPLADIDVVHCTLFGPGSLALAAHARATDTPLVLHAHVTSEDFAGSFRASDSLAPALRHLLRRWYSLADVVCCPSEYTRERLLDYPVDAPVRVVTNGVDHDLLENHRAYRDTTRERFGLDGCVVFTVGNVFERKGLSTFCELATRLDTDFVWFGPCDTGPHASTEVRRQTADPPENVTFTGWVPDIRSAYGGGDIALFPTREENQGIAILEAMACGKPVVLRRLPVFEEFYTHGTDCLMCETTDEFERALERLAADPTLRAALGQAARKTSREHGLDRVRRELLSLYGDTLDGAVR